MPPPHCHTITKCRIIAGKAGNFDFIAPPESYIINSNEEKKAEFRFYPCETGNYLFRAGADHVRFCRCRFDQAANKTRGVDEVDP